MNFKFSRNMAFGLLLFLFPLMGLGMEYNVRGCVANEKDEKIEFATVVFLDGDRQIAGTTTDVDGCFTIVMPQGKYELKVSYVGLKTFNDTIAVNKNLDLDKIVLGKNSVEMKELTVTGMSIRREADRFVMALENQPITIGKNGEDILKEAPGVWINDNKISINGKSGTKVYINDRELKMSNDQLMNYLKSFNAEDISKIEVIPVAGAEYSADTSGGIIKITLKKNRDNGLMGSARLSTSVMENSISYSPSVSVNYKKGKLGINGYAWALTRPISKSYAKENTQYADGSSQISNSVKDEKNELYSGGKIGAFYDFTDRQSIGLEVECNLSHDPSKLSSSTDLLSKDGNLHMQSIYDTKRNNENTINATFNYINKLDTVGSSFKILSQYTYDDNCKKSDNYSNKLIGAIELDSIFRENTKSKYKVFNIGADLVKVLNKVYKVKAGAKYTLNDMKNKTYFDYQKGEIWIPATAYNYDVNYDENIFAVYAIGDASCGRWKFNVGLRGEYTHSRGEGDYVKQDYFDLFPDANVNFALTDKQDYSINLKYSRSIGRPSFWDLSPLRMQISDYSYQEGNPNLKASYDNTYELSFAFAYKYSLTFNYSNIENFRSQKFFNDETDSKIMYVKPMNQYKFKVYGINVYAPIQITKWWNTSLNISFASLRQKETKELPYSTCNLLNANISFRFNLPHNFYIETSAYIQNKVRLGSIEMQPMCWLNASIKKTFDNNKWAIALSGDNILNRSNKINGISNEYTRSYLVKSNIKTSVSVSYNFNSGKKFKAHNIESNSDASRLNKSSNK